MNSPNDSHAGTSNDADVDPIDAEAAEIDPEAENRAGARTEDADDEPEVLPG